MYSLTLQSKNNKTGGIPVSTSSAVTCPDDCPLKGKGCYAGGGPLNMHWRKVTEGKRGTDLRGFVDMLRWIPEGELWRHNQAGDLPGINNDVDTEALSAIVEANKGKRGYTYTHKPVIGDQWRHNRDAIKSANDNGFTINLSADTLAEADELSALDIAPVVVVVPESAPESGETPAGRRWIVCPAQTIEGMTCKDCGYCQKSNTGRRIVAFRAHGSNKRKAEQVCKGVKS
jgi:hypothetical protein